METRRFEIVPAGKQVLVLPLLLTSLVVAGLLVSVSLNQHTPVPWPAWVACGVGLFFLALFTWLMFRSHVRLSDKGLQVQATTWPGTTRVQELDLERAEIVDLSARPELTPSVKLIGTRLPGYRAGVFWLRDKRRATVLVTDPRRVLLLPRRNGTVLLLSLQRPEALLEALRRRG